MKKKRSSKDIILPIVLVGLISGLFVLMVMRPIYGADIFYIFYPKAQNIWNGDAILYVTNTEGFFYAAHGMFYWLLLSLFSLAVANAIHLFLTIGLMIATVHIWKDYVGWSMFKTTLALGGVYTLDHLIRGQMDVVAVFGIILAFVGTKRRAPYLLGIGSTIAMIKPTNLLLPLLLIAWALREWEFREIIKAAIIPIVSIIATMLVFGVDWPLRLITLLTTGTPNVPFTRLSIWHLTEALHLPILLPIVFSLVVIANVVKYRELTAQNFAFAIVANFLISNYVGSYHYVTLIPAILCIRDRRLVFVCWLLSLLPFVRLISQDFAWSIMFLPIFVAFVLLYQLLNPLPDEAKPSDVEPVASVN